VAVAHDAITEAVALGEVVMGNTEGQGVYLRRTPRMDDGLVAWPDGTRLEVVGPQTTAEGREWLNVRDPHGQVGWVPAEYVMAAAESRQPVAADTSTEPASGVFWTVQVIAYTDDADGARRAEGFISQLAAKGLPGEAFASSRVPSMRPGFLLVLSGRFNTRQEAEAHLAAVRSQGYRDAYAREILE
jgi:hypothetical protein